MECFKYYLPIQPESFANTGLDRGIEITVSDKHASKIIGHNGFTVRSLRQKYKVEIKILGCKSDPQRDIYIKGTDRFKVFGEILRLTQN